MCSSLPGIRRIAYTDCELLPTDITLRALSSTPIRLVCPLTEIKFTGRALCESETTPDNNSQIEKTTLTFDTLDTIPTDRHLAFFVETVNSERFIIGTKEQPFPTIKISTTTGTPSGDPSIRKYEVTFTARKSLATSIY